MRRKDNGSTPDVICIQQDHYYPFGIRLAGLSENAGSDNQYLYNGKELEDYNDLHWYHYGARYYDPQLGRWLQVDPADEFYSPYVYCHNDPVNYLDKDGLFESHTNEEIATAIITLVNFVPYLNKYESTVQSGEMTPEETRYLTYQCFGASQDDGWKVPYKTGELSLLPEERNRLNNAQIVVKDVVLEDQSKMISANNTGKDMAIETISNIHWTTQIGKFVYDVISFLGLVDANQFEGVTNEINNNNE